MNWYKFSQLWSDEPFGEGVYKFVKVNGQYRFIYDAYGVKHKDAVMEGEVAESAGEIAEFDTYWKLYGSYSTSLGGVSTGDEDIVALTEIIGKPFREKVE